jgi:hypothetical protein
LLFCRIKVEKIVRAMKTNVKRRAVLAENSIYVQHYRVMSIFIVQICNQTVRISLKVLSYVTNTLSTSVLATLIDGPVGNAQMQSALAQSREIHLHM